MINKIAIIPIEESKDGQTFTIKVAKIMLPEFQKLLIDGGTKKDVIITFEFSRETDQRKPKDDNWLYE